MKRLLAVTLAGLALASAGSGAASAISRAASVPDGRPYTLRVSTVPGPHRLIVALHGWRLNAEWMETATGLDSALAKGYDVAYLDGIDAAWNAGRCCGGATTDDVGYVRDVIADAATEDVALTRNPWTAAVGFSNGGMLAWRLACDGVVRAAVVVAGSLVTGCDRPVAVLHIHGRKDLTVPFLGGLSGYTHTTFRSMLHPHLRHGSVYRVILWNGAHAWPGFATRDALRFLSRPWAHR